MTTEPRADYGVDAPYAPFSMILMGVIFAILFVISLLFHWPAALTIWWAVWTVGMLAMAASYLYTTRRGKVRVWAALLDQLALRGDEKVVDLGCGRGMVLVQAAKRLPTGQAVGVDLWRTVDQSGNSEEVTAQNATAEGVRDRIELRTGDMTELPFPDASFDLVVSSLAIHNIPGKSRLTAIDEALRVVRPGGQLAIADFRHVRAYANRLRELGANDVRVRGLGWRFWYGGPWTGTSLVTATRPA
ncbi:class I SAM-dependent methyltransferase [Fodinicola feengrottensis]|uniref:Class I SAM-dependent methyltransferase n=1 Tax=Fodinicola feengrottensis TaxID=435914 RepID=A0ABN2I166_9ACTN|nr:class I SAM-dependent methyltransferase [Fodinicola feengrottensis]